MTINTDRDTIPANSTNFSRTTDALKKMTNPRGRYEDMNSTRTRILPKKWISFIYKHNKLNKRSMRGRRSRIPITPEVPSWTTNDKQYYEEMEKEVQALIDGIGSLAASSRQHIKNVFYRILAGQTNIEWLARYEAQLPP